MSIRHEQDMYPIVGSFLKSKFGCVPVQNKIRFNLLKNWTIDVAGIVRKTENPEIVAVEVKRDLSPYSLLQAISQAEMYQKVCTRVYVAFPEEEINRFKKANARDWKKMRNLCEEKGIGVLSVGEGSSDEIQSALELPQNIDIYDDIIVQFEERIIAGFEGFDNKDFDYFLGIEVARKNVVHRKIASFLQDIKENLLKRCRELPSIDPRLLQVKLGGYYRGGCWCFISQEEKRVLSQFAHFTITIDSKGVELVVNMESDKSVDKFVRNSEERPQNLLDILHNLDHEREYQLRIWERIPPPGRERVPHYMYLWRDIFSFSTKYIDKKTVNLLIETLKDFRAMKKHSVVRLVCQSYTRSDAKLHSKELTFEIVDKVREMHDFYNFVH